MCEFELKGKTTRVLYGYTESLLGINNNLSLLLQNSFEKRTRTTSGNDASDKDHMAVLENRDIIYRPCSSVMI